MRKILNYGMVGGGPEAFVGDIHRKAINLDGKAKITAGVFSQSRDKSFKMAEKLGVAEDRTYSDYKEMAERESQRKDGIDFVIIVTPNYSHYEICKTFIEKGIDIVCDKPLTTTYEEAKELQSLAREKGLLFMVTYTYSGHVTAKAVRELIDAGEIGEVRTVMAEYPQGWLAQENENGGKQGEWRCNPKKSGKTNCLGDIGTHVENMVSKMTGLKIKKLLAKMDIMVKGRLLDDNDSILIEYENGGSGIYWSSQVAIGHNNSLRVRIYGSKGSIQWFQENPEKFILTGIDGISKEIYRGYDYIPKNAASYERLRAGHTEGLFEAMGNLYSSYIDCILAKKEGRFRENMIDYPTVDEGVQGIAFIETCLESNEKGNVWIEIK